MAVIENFILGLFSTLAGLVGGWFLLRILIATVVPDTMPDVLVKPSLSGTTVLVTLVLGIGFVALAPLFTWRKLDRTDVPGTIKVVE